VDKTNQQVQISPVEDLMREHGLLHRILLIYKDIIDRMIVSDIYTPEPIYACIRETTIIIKQFIIDYHQVLEQDYVFPTLSQHEKYKQLIQILLIQHEAAKCATDEILAILESELKRIRAYHKRLMQLMSEFIQMYEPHSAREDTVIFPAFHELTPPDTFRALGERFEDIEEQKFGENGFQNVLEHVAQIEKSLGIYDLSQFTLKCR
jgi:hemerythrin-like domain-containing protein